MKIILNSKEQIINQSSKLISDVLKQNGVESFEMVSVQLNGSFIDIADFDKIELKENDELDFLYFMGGGESKFENKKY